tara:strand:+ start:266 stop:703 length:438 start_codon:yes stop_codon:yes gene_type:complete
MSSIVIINGPNLNLLGNREENIYGNISLDKIKSISIDEAKKLNLNLSFLQSNNEGEIIDLIQNAEKAHKGLIINPAAFTHTSIAILDALRAISIPKIEVHISNIYQREEYRKKSITASAVNGIICGFGYLSYVLAIQAIYSLIEN